MKRTNPNPLISDPFYSNQSLQTTARPKSGRKQRDLD